MNRQPTVKFLLGAISIFSILSGVSVAQENNYAIPDDLTPVSKWKNGFTAEQAKHFIKNFNAKSFVVGDDIGTYGFLNLS